MHGEMNVMKAIFYTILNVAGKTKDNIKARMDLADICDRLDLHLLDMGGGKYKMAKASYTLDNTQISWVCEWVSKLKFPDGYASNLSKCVDVQSKKWKGLKSHDWHVFMQRLLPLVFKKLLPDPINDVLTQLSNFFRDLCSRTICKKDMKILETNIILILCLSNNF